MARIKDTDIALVRDRSRVDEVIGQVVTLKSAGGGSLKGLCPFHDERSPSFHVTPAKGLWHCFGCQEGGDVFAFVQQHDHLGFSEAVEKLASQYGIELHYEQGGSSSTDKLRGLRTRLAEAHKAAAEFYVTQLQGADAAVAREFLTSRQFTKEDAEHFGVGYSPQGWDGLTKQLRSKGFTDDELVTGGLAVKGSRGPYDRFRGRLMWPIRDLSGEVVGFGARKLHEDDQGPKYLNTPETPLYHKSQVLYGIDLARKEISKAQQAVIVEGYTDVMAAHLAGVPTAVATCGTAFGVDHIKVLRRLLLDQESSRGEVIFTFDGDAAGRKAALKAYDEDQRFVAQTYVAIESEGRDPCDLRIDKGPEAVRELIASRVPLFEFVIRSTLDGFDLDSAEGRVGALRAVAPIIGGIRDKALRPEYARLVAGWLGLDVAAVNTEVREHGFKSPRKQTAQRGATPGRQGQNRTQGATGPAGAFTGTQTDAGVNAAQTPRWELPDAREPVSLVERESLKCAIQFPQHVGAWYASVEPQSYTSETYRAIHEAVVTAGGPGAVADGAKWSEAVLQAAPDDGLRQHIRGLAVEPLTTSHESDDGIRAYVITVTARLLEMDATRRIAETKGKLQRTNPVTDKADYDQLFGDLVALEEYRRELRQRAAGE